jgi:hypothetical protein
LATTAARPESTESVPMVTTIGLNPRSTISPLPAPITRPSTSAAAMPDQTGNPLVIIRPQTQLASAAMPGIDRSSAPLKMPTATPAANTAVSAAALAISSALSMLAK